MWLQFHLRAWNLLPKTYVNIPRAHRDRRQNESLRRHERVGVPNAFQHIAKKHSSIKSIGNGTLEPRVAAQSRRAWHGRYIVDAQYGYTSWATSSQNLLDPADKQFELAEPTTRTMMQFLHGYAAFKQKFMD